MTPRPNARFAIGWDRQPKKNGPDQGVSIEITSVLGQSEIRMRDGKSTVSLTMDKEGIGNLIEELTTVYNMAEDE